MRIPVYIRTGAISYIGSVEIEKKEEYGDAAYKLWEKRDHEYPTLCHQCSSDVELGDWDIDTEEVDFHFKQGGVI